KILKQTIKQPRPNGPKTVVKDAFTKKDKAAMHQSEQKEVPAKAGKPAEYGMPSSHSAATSFFATYASLALLNTYPNIPTVSSVSSWPVILERPEVLAIPAATALIASAILVAWSRVKIGYHTVAQVVVGYLFGTLVAVVWFVAWCQRVSPSVGDFLLLYRDYPLINLLNP
ncbi:hypothetical protein HDV05_008662, partial [Chytridiales sp. JEL 0842]